MQFEKRQIQGVSLRQNKRFGSLVSVNHTVRPRLDADIGNLPEHTPCSNVIQSKRPNPPPEETMLAQRRQSSTEQLWLDTNDGSIPHQPKVSLHPSRYRFSSNASEASEAQRTLVFFSHAVCYGMVEDVCVALGAKKPLRDHHVAYAVRVKIMPAWQGCELYSVWIWIKTDAAGRFR